jgi:hypothetical protein
VEQPQLLRGHRFEILTGHFLNPGDFLYNLQLVLLAFTQLSGFICLLFVVAATITRRTPKLNAPALLVQSGSGISRQSSHANSTTLGVRLGDGRREGEVYKAKSPNSHLIPGVLIKAPHFIYSVSKRSERPKTRCFQTRYGECRPVSAELSNMRQPEREGLHRSTCPRSARRSLGGADRAVIRPGAKQQAGPRNARKLASKRPPSGGLRYSSNRGRGFLIKTVHWTKRIQLTGRAGCDKRLSNFFSAF